MSSDTSSSDPPSGVAHDWRELAVPESLHGARLDKAVAELLPELSRARVRRAIELGVVRVNGRRLPKGGVVSRRREISVRNQVGIVFREG